MGVDLDSYGLGACVFVYCCSGGSTCPGVNIMFVSFRDCVSVLFILLRT